ncbi:hypothetical protein [Galbibacter sp. PAP.153]|uniref:hypothetical protein n=1 Tax=Galbibacter sp. PAP.153 TaxID=3104623 RepID=UPI00300A4AFF
MILYTLTFLWGLLFIWLRKKLNYPLWSRLHVDAIDAEEILRYKFKNTRHYAKVLNGLNEEVGNSTLQDAKSIIAKAVVLAEDNSETNSQNTILPPSERRDWSGVLIFLLILFIPVFANLYRLAPNTAY